MTNRLKTIGFYQIEINSNLWNIRENFDWIKNPKKNDNKNSVNKIESFLYDEKPQAIFIRIHPIIDGSFGNRFGLQSWIHHSSKAFIQSILIRWDKVVILLQSFWNQIFDVSLWKKINLPDCPLLLSHNASI